MNLSSVIHPDESSDKSGAYRDFLGITASVACAIHCAAMPFIIGFLPLLGLSFLADPAFHKWMVGICLLLALVAFMPGWRRHRRLRPAFIGFAGLFLISLAAFAGPDDCCPTPCGDSSGPLKQAAVVPIVLLDQEDCSSGCCPPVPQAVVASMAVVSEPAPDSMGADCTVSCCPPDAVVEEPFTAGMVRWMWLLMTPLGGLVLVAAHLCNHRSSCHCSAGCCNGPAQAPEQ